MDQNPGTRYPESERIHGWLFNHSPKYRNKPFFSIVFPSCCGAEDFMVILASLGIGESSCFAVVCTSFWYHSVVSWKMMKHVRSHPILEAIPIFNIIFFGWSTIIQHPKATFSRAPFIDVKLGVPQKIMGLLWYGWKTLAPRVARQCPGQYE